MSANVRHTLGLVLAAVGGVFFVLGVGFGFAGVAMREPGAMGCAAVAVLPGAFCLWKGVVMRNRAAKESTVFRDDPAIVHPNVSITGTKKPSFLRGKGPPRPPG